MSVPTDPINYYASQGIMTDPGEYCSLLDDLPAGIPKLCKIVQNNLIHIFWAERYGVTLKEEQKQTLNLRKLSDKLSLIDATNKGSLMVKRDIHLLQVGNCRDFSLFLTAILRQQGFQHVRAVVLVSISSLIIMKTIGYVNTGRMMNPVGL
jgi:hypothetical protein